MTNCNVVKDLLPLYIEDICSEESKEMIENHLLGCDNCKKELEILKTEVIVVAEVDEKEAFHNFAKSMKKQTQRKAFLVVILSLAFMFCVGFIFYVPEFIVKYSEGLITVNIPEDGGTDIFVNLKNFKNAYVGYSVNDDDTCNVYVTVRQNVFSKLVKNREPSDQLIRLGNNMCVSFNNKNDFLQFYLPDSVTVSKVYYVNEKNTGYLDDDKLEEMKEKTLIWERE